MKKAVSLVLAAALGLGMLTGCFGGEKKTDSEVKTLDVVWFSDGKEGETNGQAYQFGSIPEPTGGSGGICVR